MEVRSTYVGQRCRPLEIEVTARRCMNYAASIFDSNPWHFDDERPEGIVAPPMLGVAYTWRLSERFAEFWQDSDFPMEVLARQVHYSEIVDFARPMRPGDRLRIEGEVAAILAHPAGTHLILRYTATDAAGETVFTEYIGGMLRDVKCIDGGAGAANVPAMPRPAGPANPRWDKRIHIHPLAAHLYDGCADIHFPIHTSPAFAHRVGLPDPIYMGTATMAIAVSEIVHMEAAGDPRRVRRICGNFTGMVMPNSDITVQVTRKEPLDGGAHAVYYLVLNAEGKRAIRNGCVVLAD